MTKFLTLIATFATASLLTIGAANAEAQCTADASGFLACAEGKLSADTDIQVDQQLGEYTRHPHRRPPHRRPPHYPPHYPPPRPHYPPPAPFCYTPSGFCRMVVATPPGVYCTCNFGYFWDNGVTGY